MWCGGVVCCLSFLAVSLKKNRAMCGSVVDCDGDGLEVVREDVGDINIPGDLEKEEESLSLPGRRPCMCQQSSCSCGGLELSQLLHPQPSVSASGKQES